MIKLAILPGDGIGKDVTFSAIPILEALNIPVEIYFGDIGWEFWRSEGNPVPQRTWDLINKSDAVLLGATTSKPQREALEELPIPLREQSYSYISPIIQLRQNLDLYANVRPCFSIKEEAEQFNFSIIRENTEGLYAGLDFYPIPSNIMETLSKSSRWSQLNENDAACSLRLQTRSGLSRLFEFAFLHAKKEGYSRVTFADKPNVLRNSSAFARDIFESVAQKYPLIKADIHNVDAVALWMVKRPQEFGVIVAENMFGDILSDLGAGIMGGLGFAGSANFGEKGCYFEPVHGSAPRLKPNTANPSAMFLTIALFLENFGYREEANKIKNAIREVIKKGKNLTYDLGGNASTEKMSKEILQQCLSGDKDKKISFLATGAEIIKGDIQDSNGNHFAKSIDSKGGNIYQHIQASDKKSEISDALKYLLCKSDAVIITGGLGPTSDDTTRFAIADTLKLKLEFNEIAWESVVKRLTKFNLPVTESNRQQALFPENSEPYPNENGTAWGCHIKWQDKNIFMLPGPPKEAYPLFNEYVLDILNRNQFFRKKELYRWLTLGLIEGEIAPEIEKIIMGHTVEIGYRWNYPYLEIKLENRSSDDISEIIDKIEKLLVPYLVSRNEKGNFEILSHNLKSLKETLYLIDNITLGNFSKEMDFSNLKIIDSVENIGKFKCLLVLKSYPIKKNDSEFSGSLIFECDGYFDNEKKYEHKISVPNRGIEVVDYGKAYISWQISQFIKSIGVDSK